MVRGKRKAAPPASEAAKINGSFHPAAGKA
jgi:hypothetical protein